jgi:hypothetical protein
VDDPSMLSGVVRLSTSLPISFERSIRLFVLPSRLASEVRQFHCGVVLTFLSFGRPEDPRPGTTTVLKRYLLVFSSNDL